MVADFRNQQSDVAREQHRARETVKAVERRLPAPGVMSATVHAWDGSIDAAEVVPDDSAESDVPDPVWATSFIGAVGVEERVWILRMEDTAYIIGRATTNSWLPVKNGNWYPKGGGNADPYLGAGAVTQAGFRVKDGNVAMLFTITLGTGASNNPAAVGVGHWQFPIPFPIIDDVGWDIQNRTMTFGSAYFYDGTGYVGTFLATPGQQYVEMRIHGSQASLGRLNFPLTQVDQPLANTQISGEFTYPGGL